MLISYYLPSNNLTNDTLETLYAAPSWTASKIYRKTGIKSRPIAGTELVSDMAVKAAQNLFDEYNISPQDIDFVLLCTQSPDYFLPTTACLVQERLGIPTTSGAFDYNLGCSGYIYGLATAKGLLCAGIAKNILLITAETYTKHINPLDRSTRTVFGDAAAATYLTIEDIDLIGNLYSAPTVKAHKTSSSRQEAWHGHEMTRPLSSMKMPVETSAAITTST